jgi:hypothetical protein
MRDVHIEIQAILMNSQLKLNFNNRGVRWFLQVKA